MTSSTSSLASRQRTPPSTTFLGVERSVTGRRWRDRLSADQVRLATAIAQQHDLPELLGRVLAGRGVLPETCQEFLAPSLRTALPDPSILQDMDLAAERIAHAVMRGERIAVFGDYDVDGATSSALLARFLKLAGSEAAIYIPDRIFEGYGPNREAFETLRGDGAELIVCVDCGTSSFEALTWAHDTGLDVVVLDHHQTGSDLPPALALVNPNRQDDMSGLGHLCAAGITFLAAIAVNRMLRAASWFAGERREPDLLSLLDLVALGTVCDVVPLTDLNRAFVAKGLLAMRRRDNIGLAALAEIARLSAVPDVYALGFVLGPRINAGGRIGRADLGARLLSGDDSNEVHDIAATLDRLNQERQDIERRILEEATAEADANLGARRDAPLVLTTGDDWHPGVVGLVASRLKDRFRRPAIAIAFDSKGIGSGSGRSIPGVDLGRVIRAGVDTGILVKGGGHSMAAGLTVEKAKLADLRAFLHEQLLAPVTEAHEIDEVTIDGALTAGAARPHLIDMLGQAGPYGAGNPEPCFAFPAHRITSAQIVGKGHVRCTLRSGDGSTLQAIAFRVAETPLGQFLLSAPPMPVHVAGFLKIDRWGGGKRTQLQIVDAAASGG